MSQLRIIDRDGSIPLKQQIAVDCGQRAEPPVFGFMLVGGPLVGAQVRDIRLANELARRGYPVHVWWAFDWPRDHRLDPSISQQWLFTTARYTGALFSWTANELLGRTCNFTLTDKLRHWISQNYPDFMAKQMRAVIRLACGGVEQDARLIRRFAADLARRRVTHLLPCIEILALFAAAARRLVSHPLEYLVTFQGYEVYANFAREVGLEEQLYERLAEVVAGSRWPAVAVSEAYSEPIRREVGVPAEQLIAIPPGIPCRKPLAADEASQLVQQAFPQYRADLPLIAYVGRRDAEKGIDLLLYASKLLQYRDVPFQLAICGPSAFGGAYGEACTSIAQHLRSPVLWNGFVSDEVRAALFRASRAVVYPSIHEEPFGMVPVEALAQGTPVLVPNLGGVAGVIEAGSHCAGLRFNCWDTRDLADKLQVLIEQPALHAQLSAAAPHVAANFSVEKLGERILDHVNLPHWQGTSEADRGRSSAGQPQAKLPRAA